MCSSTHFYNPKTQISFVEHDDLVLVCAIIKHMSETEEQKQHRISGPFIRSCVLLKVDDWNQTNRTLNGITFDSPGVKVVHRGRDTVEDKKRGQVAATVFSM